MKIALLILLATLGIAALVFFMVALSKAHYLKYHKSTQHKFSDAEVFRVMSNANHFITAKQLAAISTLSEKEARTRLSYLAIFGVLHQFVCSAIIMLMTIKSLSQN
jgi:predicted permease